MPVYSDMNGFPESGFPVLSNDGDGVCLNTLYWNPLKSSGYILDIVGASRLGAVTITAAGAITAAGSVTAVGVAAGGAISGATTVAASGTVTLSSATAPLTMSGATAVMSMTGSNAVFSMTGLNASIGTILARIRRGWFRDIDTYNVPTVQGEPVALIANIVTHEAKTDAHTATNITNTPAGDIAATNVQSAIDELDTELATLKTDVDTAVTVTAGGEIHLTPKASSTGAEGTMFYCSDDDQVYVATE